MSMNDLSSHLHLFFFSPFLFSLYFGCGMDQVHQHIKGFNSYVSMTYHTCPLSTLLFSLDVKVRLKLSAWGILAVSCPV